MRPWASVVVLEPEDPVKPKLEQPPRMPVSASGRRAVEVYRARLALFIRGL